MPRIGNDAITPQTVAQIVQTSAMAAGYGRHDPGGHSLKRGALTTGMDRGIHSAKLKRLDGQGLQRAGGVSQVGNLFEGRPLTGVL